MRRSTYHNIRQSLSPCIQGTNHCVTDNVNSIQQLGTGLGLTAAFGVGILAGIESAIMWPEHKLATGLIFGGSSAFVNSLSYYYVVMRKPDKINENHYLHVNTPKSTLFVLLAVFFGGVMFVSNFNGMYVSFTVLGERLNDLGDTNAERDIPSALLIGLGLLFGVASALSGLIFNIKVGHKLWNNIRRTSTSLGALNNSEFAPLIDSRENPSLESGLFYRRHGRHRISDSEGLRQRPRSLSCTL